MKLLTNIFGRKVAINTNLHATLCPSFSHFRNFCYQQKFLAGIRVNSAMITLAELDQELTIIDRLKPTVPLYYDVKGRQLRVQQVLPNMQNLELILNRPISVETPSVVLFKAGADVAILKSVEDDGYKLIFDGGPKFMVKAGESLHIRHPSLRVGGNLILDYEIEKIKKVVSAGFNKFYLSYVEYMAEVKELRKLIGNDSDLVLKIENLRGLQFVKNYVSLPNTRLMAARGDLYVEVEKPHDIINAVKLIVEKDNTALVGSRLLLSVVKSPVPECSDFSDLAFLYEIGYRNFLLCDELCLKRDLLQCAVSVFSEFFKEKNNGSKMGIN